MMIQLIHNQNYQPHDEKSRDQSWRDKIYQPNVIRVHLIDKISYLLSW